MAYARGRTVFFRGGGWCRNSSRPTASFRYGTAPRPPWYDPHSGGSLFCADVGPFCAPITILGIGCAPLPPLSAPATSPDRG